MGSRKWSEGGDIPVQISIEKVRIKERQRSLDKDYVKELADSIQELGLLNPITIDEKNVLIAGMHRLEAAKRLGWSKIECTVSSLEGIPMKLAEIDENFVRRNLSALEYGEALLHRKELYEMLHPETRQGGDRKSKTIKTTKSRFDGAKSFTQDTAEKLGVTPRTIERQIQVAKNLGEEAKKIILDSKVNLSKQEMQKLSRLEPMQQKEAALLFAAKEIKNIEEYSRKAGKSAAETEQQTEPEKEERTEEEETAEAPMSVSMVSEIPSKEQKISLKEVIAQLKDPDKDCSGTPDSFLEEYAAFVRKFQKEIAWYSNSYYDRVYSLINKEQLARLRQMTDSICCAAKDLFHQVERIRKT